MDMTQLEQEAIRTNEQFFAINLSLGDTPVVQQPASNNMFTRQQTLNLSFALIGCAIAVGIIIVAVRSRKKLS